MNVKQLIEKLQKADPEMIVYCTSNTGEFEYCVVNTAGVKGLRLDAVDYEDEDDDTNVFVIDEE